MNSVDWPMRLVPRRKPGFGVALAVSVLSLMAAIAARAAFLGVENALGLSATYFPAFIITTLYGGALWGWATFAVVLAIGLFTPSLIPAGVSQAAIMVQFFVSGGFTVAVAAALRESLVRLDEARRLSGEMESALAATEQRLRLAQDAGSVGLWDWDLVTGEAQWSPMFYRNMGLEPGGPANLERILQIVHPEDQAMVRTATTEAAGRAELDPLEYRVIWPDGAVHWLYSRGEVILDDAGRPARAVGVTIDVTERRIAYEQVRQSEARFRALADSAPVPMWVSKTDGKRAFVNQAYVAFLGAPYEEALNFDWRKRLHPDDLDRILREQVAGEASRQLFTLEARYFRVGGEVCWLRSFSQPRYSPTGEFEGFIGIAVDITEAKRAEGDLKRINELLAERVEAALSERDQAEAALRRAQKLEAVGQLTGGVAHDFNNLLTVVIGALDLMQRHPNDASRRDRMIEAALEAARRGERLTQQLLAFARRQALKPQVASIDGLVRESEPLLRRAVGEAVNLSFADAEGEVLACIDPGQFEAALMNLVVNARDAVSAGGTIRVETAACRLASGEVEEVEAGDYVCVAVHDTGVGMDADTLGRSFEPFFTTKDVGKGTGLGLSQVYGFARQSGGGVAITSAPGKGASVKIYLPRVREAVAAPDAEPAARPVETGAGLRVLLVEDDPAVGDMVEALLESLGHAVRRAESADAALKVLKGRTRVDLMLTDIVMPGGKSGFDLAREAVGLRPDLPIILSSGYTGEVLAGADAAPWPLLRKPYSGEALARLIQDVMERAPEAA